MIDFSLIMLSNTTDEFIYKMNLGCLTSFIKSSEKGNYSYELLLVETHKDSIWKYDFDNLKVISPNKKFNFHKFLNLGIAEAKGRFYVLSNNDVVFDDDCLNEIIKVQTKNIKLKSFSPYDESSNKLPMTLVNNSSYIIGYEIQKHLAGWCLIVEKSVFNTIKKLDETFDFYYADFDYAMQLQQHNIAHALVTNAKAKHLESMNSKKEKNACMVAIPKNIPKYIIEENWTWVLENEKMMEGLIKFHNKWGSRKLIKIKCYLSSKLRKIGLGYLNKFIFAIK